MMHEPKGLVAGAKGLEPSTSAVTGQRPSNDFKADSTLRSDKSRAKGRDSTLSRNAENRPQAAKTPRVDRVTGPLVVGQTYLVKTVAGKFYDKIMPWPVIGAVHDDVEFFGVSMRHYHIDGRFLSSRVGRLRYERATGGAILHPHELVPLLEPTWRKLKCVRVSAPLSLRWDANFAPFERMQAALAGQKCQSAAAGFVCPHRKAALGSIVPYNGVITCPLHGLRIDAATGVVLPTGVR